MPDEPTNDADLAKIMAESARLRRQSAELPGKLAERDEKLAACLSPPPPKHKPPQK